MLKICSPVIIYSYGYRSENYLKWKGDNMGYAAEVAKDNTN